MFKRIPALLLVLLLSLTLCACGCRHEWEEATCTVPKKCTLCGATEGEAAEHSWLQANCKSPKTCSVCKLTEGTALGHNWTDATCTEPKTCTLCQETEGKPQGHIVETWTTTAEPTCTKTGISSGKCSICNKAIETDITKVAHTPGQWKITKEATAAEAGERTKTCTVCGSIVEKEEYEMSAEEVKADYIASCKTYSYNEIARNPDAYKGKRAKFTGEVIQVQQESFYGLVIYVLRVDVTKTGSYYVHYEDTVYVTYYATADEPRILEDDIITMYGELEGEKTYTTVLGSSVTIPEFSAEYIEIH